MSHSVMDEAVICHFEYGWRDYRLKSLIRGYHDMQSGKTERYIRKMMIKAKHGLIRDGYFSKPEHGILGHPIAQVTVSRRWVKLWMYVELTGKYHRIASFPNDCYGYVALLTHLEPIIESCIAAHPTLNRLGLIDDAHKLTHAI